MEEVIESGDTTNTHRLEAAIFDMDGVLVDSEVEWERVFRGILAERGAKLSEADRLDLYGCADDHENVVLARILGIAVDEMARIKHEYCEEHPIDYAAIATDGGRELVLHLKDTGLKLALASSSLEKDVCRMLAETGMDELFDVVVTGDHVEHAKPDPEIYVLAASSLGVSPDNAVAIDDSLYGAQSALEAGLHLICFDRTGENGPVEGALATCEGHAQVGRLIDAIINRGFI